MRRKKPEKGWNTPVEKFLKFCKKLAKCLQDNAFFKIKFEHALEHVNLTGQYRRGVCGVLQTGRFIAFFERDHS